MTTQPLKKTYLGDGVYLTHYHDRLVLTAENGIQATDTIHLEPEVCAALVRSLGLCSKEYAASAVVAAAPDLLAACRRQHDALDTLFARLIQIDPGFLPSKSGEPWAAMIAGTDAIAKAAWGSR